MYLLESSEDKTVRRIIYYLSNYQWKYQYSIFVDVYSLELDEAKAVVKEWLLSFDDSKFREYLRKKNKNTGMMYVIRKTTHKNHSSGKRFQQYYITIFASDAIDGIDNVSNYGDCIYKVIDRKITDTKIETTCNALKTQQLHDISSLGSKKRYTVINKSKLIPKVEALS